MTQTAVAETPFEAFARRQTDLNRFLWTTELVYGLVKKEGLLDRWPAQSKAWDALADVRSEAWFPSTKGRHKYDGTIGEMRTQIDANFVIVLWSVAAMFVADFETFVEARFPGWLRVETANSRGRPFMIPAPAALVDSLRAHFEGERVAAIAADVVLKADLMKKIRNLYVHRGLAGVPRAVADREIAAWIAQVGKRARYPTSAARTVAQEVIGGAVRSSSKAAQSGKPLREEFFYALYTFTNIRNFASALDRAFPADGAAAVARRPAASSGRSANRSVASATRVAP